jgi:hypothetical protein
LANSFSGIHKSKIICSVPARQAGNRFLGSLNSLRIRAQVSRRFSNSGATAMKKKNFIFSNPLRSEAKNLKHIKRKTKKKVFSLELSKREQNGSDLTLKRKNALITKPAHLNRVEKGEWK